MPVTSHYQYQNLPPWMAGQHQFLGERAEGLSQAPYQKYKGKRRAPFMNPDLEQAYGMGREVNDVAPYLDSANALATQGAQGTFDNDAAAQYMNPYQQQVINSLIQNSGKAFNENILPALRREFISSGNFGGTQHNQQAERAASEQQRVLNDQIAQSLMGGYTHAGKMFESAKARQLEGSEKVGNLGPIKQASRLADIQALKYQGQEQRADQQADLDTEYEDFQRQTAHPYENLSYQAGILAGIPSTHNTYNRTQTPGVPQGNTWSNVGDIAGSIYGARMAYGRKAGGTIKQPPKSLSRLPLNQGTMARKPKPGGSHGIRPLKNKHKLSNGTGVR